MLLAHKIEMRPTPEQEAYLLQAMGCRRHCYNQLLAHFTNNKYSKKEARRKYTELRQIYEFYGEVSQRASRNAVDDLDSAFQHFFRRVRTGKKPGYPKFKKRGIRDSFALREKEKFDVIGRELRLEKLKTKIKLRQKLRFDGITKQITISQKGGRWFASVLVETDSYETKTTKREPSSVVGVDLGIKTLAVLSDGVVIPALLPLKRGLTKLKKLNRQLAKKQKGSNRWEKAKTKLSEHHYFIGCKREAYLHELTDMLTRQYETIVIEDLDVAGMVKNRSLSRAISDCGFGRFRQMLEYKAFLRGNTIVVADRFFPSSKKCSACGEIKTDLTLADRTYSCYCGLELDRDLNAAINLEHVAQRLEDTQQNARKNDVRPGTLGNCVDDVNECDLLH